MRVKTLTKDHIRVDETFKEADRRLIKIIHDPFYQLNEQLRKSYDLHGHYKTHKVKKIHKDQIPTDQEREELGPTGLVENSVTQNGIRQETPAIADHAKPAAAPTPTKKPTYLTHGPGPQVAITSQPSSPSYSTTTTKMPKAIGITTGTREKISQSWPIVTTMVNQPLPLLSLNPNIALSLPSSSTSGR
ncbi:hypothetical protein BP6252_05901 [Coleophoma cylindrospora]|uniref:Uncharacterized protein n=1 Tax=Coleophoma cylindrospora TaxID=1849047 RepID=A0A3D8RL51_9HELO|nr:hypothetical protein BP6252_05901 [Coleophoma cylindrospora]